MLRDAQALLPDEQLRLLDTVKSSERNIVLRVQATAANGARRTLIVKHYLGRDEGWLRETAALASVPGAVRVPALVAVGDALLVSEDLGNGSSLADALLGDDPDAAGEALHSWATALAELHCATRESRGAFAASLAHRAAQRPQDQPDGHEPAESWMPARLLEAERVLDRNCGALGVTIPTGALAALTGLGERLGGETLAALTPADACPDNNVRVGDRLVLIDFEGAQWRHIAWDLAYLAVPWPTCWCAWRIPDHIADTAIACYRTRAAEAFPQVADDAFVHDVEAAAVGWALTSAAWSLDYALGPEVELDQQLEVAGPTPTRRALIMHRLSRAAGTREVPELAELAGSLHTELLRRWGDVPLHLAPAFRPPA